MDDTRTGKKRLVAMALIAAGVLLHLVNCLLDWHGQAPILSLALFAWSSFPYLVALLLLFSIRHSSIVIVGVVGPLVVDLVLEYLLYITKPTSTAALDMFFAPLLNMLLIEPLSLLLGWLWVLKSSGRSRRGANLG